MHKLPETGTINENDIKVNCIECRQAQKLISSSPFNLRETTANSIIQMRCFDKDKNKDSCQLICKDSILNHLSVYKVKPLTIRKKTRKLTLKALNEKKQNFKPFSRILTRKIPFKHIISHRCSKIVKM